MTSGSDYYRRTNASISDPRSSRQKEEASARAHAGNPTAWDGPSAPLYPHKKRPPLVPFDEFIERGRSDAFAWRAKLREVAPSRF
jgi:hypothetical protein